MGAFAQTLEELAQGILEAPWARVLYGVRWVFIFLDLIVVVAFIIVLMKARGYRPVFVRNYKKKEQKPRFNTKMFEERFGRIMKTATKSPPQSYVLSIIEADKLVDDALKLLGLQGEHLADRLQKLRTEDYPTLDRLWRAHRVRNELVHTPDFGIDTGDAEDVLKVYEKFLKELGALPK